MSEEDNFLSRWSRRKRAALDSRQEPTAGDALPQTGDGPDLQINAPAADPRSAEPRPHAASAARSISPQSDDPAVFDLSKLPSIDSIGPQTDIRLFMQAGVPAALKRAALRQAWAADPAIRDYIGLSENSWDFTAPDSMPGFGALDPAEAKKMVAQIFRQMTDDVQHGSESGTEDVEAEAITSEGESVAVRQSDKADAQRQGESPAKEAPVRNVIEGDVSARPTVSLFESHEADRSAAMQHHATGVMDDSDAETLGFRKRTHGGALPQ